jgi:prepilin-type N-terminal cleavage/methylation domain-containing protein
MTNIKYQMSNKNQSARHWILDIRYWTFDIPRRSGLGFTLIELLVVIGILGILAAAVIATIDPFEQLKKASDAAAKSTASEFVNATTRYYGNHNAYPWDPVANGGALCNGGIVPSGTPLYTTTVTDCITALITDGEVKSSFANPTNILKEIFTTGPADPLPFTACYKPQSKSGQKDLNTKYTVTGGAGVACKSAGGANDCYYCVQ